MPEIAPSPGSLAEALATIPDPRRAHLRVHDLVPLLQFAVVALLCGCRSLYAMAQWGRERRADDPDLLLELGLRPGRSPSVATLHRVFKQLDAAAFERALGDWLARSGVAPGEPLAVDGKTLRGVHGEGIPGAHLVSVYALRARAVLAQIRTGAKGGELGATKEALAQVDLRGRVVMGDALQTQREVCTQIVGGGGDYLLPVKENQPTLLADLEAAFSPTDSGSTPHRERPAGARVVGGGLAAAGSEADGGLSSGAQGAARAAGAAGDVGALGPGVGSVCGERGRGGAAVATPAAALLGAAGAHGEGSDDGGNRLRDHQRGLAERGSAPLPAAQPGVLGDRERAALGARRHPRGGSQPGAQRGGTPGVCRAAQPGHLAPAADRDQQHRRRPPHL